MRFPQYSPGNAYPPYGRNYGEQENHNQYQYKTNRAQELDRLKGGNQQNPYDFSSAGSSFPNNIKSQNNVKADNESSKRKMFRYALGGAMTKDSSGLPRASGGLGVLHQSSNFFADFLGTDLKKICKCQWEGTWDIHDRKQIMFQAVETTSFLGLCCCAPNHSTEIRFYQNDRNVMTVRRKFVYPDCLPVCSPCSQWKATLEDENGNEIGTIVDKAALCKSSSICGVRPEWEFIDPYNNLEARVTGPMCCVTGLCRDTFKIESEEGGTFGKIGRETGKRLSTAITCCLCPAIILEDNFEVDTSNNPPVSVKAKLIALRVLEDWGFFRTDALCWLSCLPCTDGDPCQWSLNLNLWLCDLFCGGCRWPCYVRFQLPVECNPTTGECVCCGLEDGCNDGCCGDCGDACCGDCNDGFFGCEDDCGFASCMGCDCEECFGGFCQCLEDIFSPDY